VALDASQRRARVLLVEDNPVNLLVAQRLLGVLGLECETATNGERALACMTNGHYDLVLMDCQMPVLDGYTATRRWREHEHRTRDQSASTDARLPIIAMTANAMAGDRQQCLEAGMDDYLAKPVTRDQLAGCLQRWLAGDADAVRVRSSAMPPPPPSTATPAPASADAPPAHTNPPSALVFDADILAELQSVLGEETEHIVRVFLEDTPQLLAQMEQAALGPDYPALRAAAHSLKSSSANLGALALSEAAKQVELGARAQALDRPAVAVAMVAEEFARARQALLARSSTAAAA
jgi:CheY-like chemotaxis protein